VVLLVLLVSLMFDLELSVCVDCASFKSGSQQLQILLSVSVSSLYHSVRVSVALLPIPY
jgi:hypothetical protein